MAIAPTNLTLNTDYPGEVLSEIRGMLALGFETGLAGVFRVHTNIQKAVYIPRMKLNNLIQARAATPSSQGSAVNNELKITPGDMMVYYEFNPRDYEQWWREFQPTGNLLFRELNSEVQIAMMQEILNAVLPGIDNLFWNGDTAGAAPLSFIDGLIKQLDADANVRKAGTPVVLTPGNIVAEMGKLETLLLGDKNGEAVWRHPNFKFLMSTVDYQKYRTAQQDQTSKGIDFTQDGIRAFQGKPIIDLPYIPENKIVGGVFSTGTDSNLHWAVDLDLSDSETIQVEKVQANSELYFAKLLWKGGVGYTWSEEIVYYPGA